MRLLLAAIALAAFMTPAYAQRCPAGHDQFLNCYSLDQAARARHERWANQPAARQIPGAQPYGASGGGQTTLNSCVYRRAVQLERAGNPRYMRYKREADRRGGTFEASGSAIRDVPEFQALKRQLFRECGASP
jgi:hypothetical protein